MDNKSTNTAFEPHGLKEYISTDAIRGRVAELAAAIEKDILGREAVLVANLKGSFVFFADLVRAISRLDITLDFLSTESYRGTESTGVVRITRDLGLSVSGRTVILVEDILDTGLTMDHLVHYLYSNHQAHEVRTCVLLDKPSRRRVNISPDYRGFEIDNSFVVGYGLDYNEQFRNLPYIGVINPSANPE